MGSYTELQRHTPSKIIKCAKEHTMEYGILGLLWTILVIWALVRIVQSGASPVAKIIWALVVIAFPVIGIIAWLVAGPR